MERRGVGEGLGGRGAGPQSRPTQPQIAHSLQRGRPAGGGVAVCGMRNPSILKENIDGEALLWASRRLLTRQESRKVLIVISDGAPADQATLEENEDKSILDRNLRDVILEIENSGCIELAALGVKHDVSRYYRNHVYVENLDKIGDSLVRIIDNLLI